MWPCGVLRMSHENCIFREDMAKWKKNQCSLPFWRDFKKEIVFPILFCHVEEEAEICGGRWVIQLPLPDLRPIEIYIQVQERDYDKHFIDDKKLNWRTCPGSQSAFLFFTILEIWLGLPGPWQISRAYSGLCGRKKYL